MNAPKTAGSGGAKQAVVIDAPPAMAKLLQSTLSARFNATINRDALSAAPTSKEVRAVTSPVKALAVVLARPTGDAWTITVLNGADGTPLETQNFTAAARKPLKALPKNVAGALVLACSTGQAPPGAAAPVSESSSRDPKADAVAATGKGPQKKEGVVANEPDPVPGTIEHSFAQVVARLEAARAEIPKMHYPDFEASPPPSGWRDPHARAEGGLQIAGLPDAPKPPEKVNRLDAIKNVAPPDPTKIDPAKFPGGIVPTKMPPRRMFGKMPGRGR
jgi:hypothetical protein